MTHKRDANAPDSLDRHNGPRFQRRNDVTSLCEEKKLAADKIERQKLQSKLQNLLEACRFLSKWRKGDYFEAADSSRAGGRMAESQAEAPSRQTGNQNAATAAAICPFFQNPTDQKHSDDYMASVKEYTSWSLLPRLSRRFQPGGC
ncbi:MAG: hypothetical protein Q9198_010466, partial [Flavoplaca austrocitrina]